MSAVANCIAWTGLELALAAIATAATPLPEVLPLKVPPAPPGFTAMNPAETGVTFTNELDSWISASNRVLNNGSGVAAGDFDGDGRVDLFFCSLNQQNRLFRNRGNWQFEDVTAQAGLHFPPLFYRAAVFADIDGDGWLDLLVGTVGQGVLCFLNDQHGHFKDVTASANITNAFGTETLALADVDGNGTLDLYVANNRTDDTRDWPRIPVMYVNKKPTVSPQLRNRLTFENGVVQEFGEPDTLYLNDGRGHFSAVPWTNGVFLDEKGAPLTNAPLDWGLAAGFRDLNGDGAPDLYVCNDYWTPDRMWLNDGRGHFRAVGALAWRKMPASSMGVDFADIDRDGWVDIFAVDMLSRSSELRRR
ncbi:MAG TPA: VCBS repeat-containing protein, partial [Candidatus Dormibacteraeota bacterium]|nr:VCBS repeat-containing protein [Candidatus Dormibacteraeota bacterium]